MCKLFIYQSVKGEAHAFEFIKILFASFICILTPGDHID
jgi:hypothetical protein